MPGGGLQSGVRGPGWYVVLPSGERTACTGGWLVDLVGHVCSTGLPPALVSSCLERGPTLRHKAEQRPRWHPAARARGLVAI